MKIFISHLTTIFLLTIISLPLAAQFEVRQLDSPASCEAEFGLTFAGINDINGDRLSELVVGSPLETVNGVNAVGRVYVISGIDGTTLYTINTPNPEESGLFGRFVAIASDTNYDGVEDIIVAAWKEDHSGLEDAGRAYLFSGTNGNLLQTFISVEPVIGEFWWNSPVCGVSDINSDGAGDVAIGVKLGRTNGLQTGRVDIFNGNNGNLIYSLVSPDAKSGGFFGTSLVSYADIDNDGFIDIAVGAEQEDFNNISRSGNVHIFRGFDGTHLFSIAPPNPDLNGYFGHSIAALDDLNGDGVADLLVGAIQEKNSQGRAYVFSGADGNLIHTLQSPDTSKYRYFGESVSKINDLNGDGICEMLIGTPLTEFLPWYAGAAFIFDGNSGNLLHSLQSPNQSQTGFFGQTVSYVSELNSIGESNFLVGAHGEGKIYIYSQTISFLDKPTENPIELPQTPQLYTNYPNPFNPTTTIRYSLQAAGIVSTIIYDLQGKPVKDLVNQYMPGGKHDVVWDGRDNQGNALPSGVYLFRLKTGESATTGKMILSR